MNPHFMALALRMAQKSRSRYKLGAVVVCRGRVVGMGYNTMEKTHPAMKRFSDVEWDPSIHAEVHACLGVPESELIGSEVYVGRLNRSGLISLAKPCSICQRFMGCAGVSSVYYSVLGGVEVMNLGGER